MKDESGGKVMTKFVGLRANTYSSLIDDGSEDKPELWKDGLSTKIAMEFNLSCILLYIFLYDLAL